MKTKINGILTLLLAFMVQMTFAQERTISGVVSDEMGPVADISVKVKGTNKGAVTDFDGNYAIKAKTGDTLEFTHVSYGKVIKVVGTSTKINVTVKESGESLTEVVITGYSEKTRDELTSAVSIVTGSELAKLAPSTTLDNMLQGKAAGVNVTAANGQPGKTAYVRIRGVGSINASSAPLYVIDGVVGVDINSVTPGDIESMAILKDAATSSLYGSRGANGVIVITTKTGRKNKSGTITINSSIGYGQKISDNFKMMNASQKLQYESELAALGVTTAFNLPGNTITNQTEYDALTSLNHDWQKTLLRKAYMQSNAVSFTGGSEKTSYFLSLGHDRNTGIIKDINGFEKISGRINLGFDVKEWLTINTNLGITTTTSDEPRDRNNVQNPFRAMYGYNPYEPKYQRDSSGEYILDTEGNKIFNNTHSGFSISEALIRNPEEKNYTYIVGGVSAKINFTDNLDYTFKIGGGSTVYRREYFVEPGSVLDGYVAPAGKPGSKTDNGSNTFDYTVTNLVDYKKTFAEKHNFKISGLFEFNKRKLKEYSFTSINFSNPNLSEQSTGAEAESASTDLYINTLVSFGTFLEYNYDGKYLATASYRKDGASQFGTEYRYGDFWSVSGAWNLHKENFLENHNIIDELRLRASLGTSGNRAGIGSYAALPIISNNSIGAINYAYPTSSGNPNLKWETQKMFDVGTEFKLFNKRLSGVVDYYVKETSDLLLNAPLSAIGGTNSGSLLKNIGTMVNKGLELELRGDIIRKDDFLLQLGGNITFIDNEITQLVPSVEHPDGAPIIRNFGILQVGEEFNTYNLVKFAGVNPANGEPLYYDSDGNISPTYDSNANVVLSGKSTIADFDGGFNLYTSYKSFDFGADFYFKIGHYVYNQMEMSMLSDGSNISDNQRVDAFNYWRQPGDTNVLPSPIYNISANQFSDRFLQKADYIRLRNLTLGYNMPSKFTKDVGIKSIRFYLQAQNLWTWAPYFTGDPEVGIGSSETDNSDGFGSVTLYSYPQVQSVSVGLNLKF